MKSMLPFGKKAQTGLGGRRGAGSGMMGAMASESWATTRGLGMAAGRAAGWTYGRITKEGGLGLLIWPILLWIFDFAAGYSGIQWTYLKDIVISYFWSSGNFASSWQWIFRSPFLFFFICYVIWRRPQSKEDWWFYFAFTFIFTLLFMLINGNLWIFVHFLFAMCVFVLLLKGFRKDVEITQDHWVFLVIVLLDIIAIPSLNSIFTQLNIATDVALDFTNKLLFPIWFFYFFTFIRESTWKSRWKIFIMVCYFSYFGFHIWSASGQLLAQTDPAQRQAAIDAPGKSFKNLKSLINTWFSDRIQYAVTGKVEKNKQEPLGVYIEQLRSAQPFYYEGEDIVLWGLLKARTLDDPVGIKLSCYIKDGTNKIQATKIDPEKSFVVFTQEQQDFACMFKSNTLKDATSKIIAVQAEFNFETLAYVKAYFMDMERLRAMTREKQDPFVEYNIKDKNPQSVATNGPAKITLGTTTSLIGVSDSYVAYPRLTVNFQNNDGWLGKITNIKELVLLMPKGAEIIAPEFDCNLPFQAYTEDNCKMNSCNILIFGNCSADCNGYSGNARASCQARCTEKQTTCHKECTYLFNEEGQQYTGYNLVISDKLKISIDEAERFKFFTCKINLKPEEILEKTPLTTKSFRVKARYDYIVEKTISAEIRKDPLKKGTTSTNPPQAVLDVAKNINFQNPALVSAIATVESNNQHCKPGYQCGTDVQEGVLCDAFDNCGIMRISKTKNPELFNPYLDASMRFGCLKGQTAYDMECNIKIGAGLLSRYYNQYGTNKVAYESFIDANCPNVDAFYGLGPENTKYKAYTDSWDRAIRVYGGADCGTNSRLDYVERVKTVMGASGYQTDPWSGVKQPGATLNPPTNVQVTRQGDSLVITWTRSTDDALLMPLSYHVYRTIDGGAEHKLSSEPLTSTSYSDNKEGSYYLNGNLDPDFTKFGTKYSYVIEVSDSTRKVRSSWISYMVPYGPEQIGGI